MARLKYVKAWGLWSHWESVFNFAPGLTVITGPNGSGKSGLISIIRWVFIGEPTGDKFIFKLEDEKTKEVIKQAEEGKAEIGLDNGVVITKTRRKEKTIYTINTIAEPFEKAEVPQEVKDTLGIDLYKFGDFETYLNFAFQLEAPFLISESPSVGAKVLGKLAGTEAVDLAIADQSKKAHKARDDKRIAEKAIAKCNGDLLAYQDIDDSKAQLDACVFLIEEVDKAADRRATLNTLANSHCTAKENITKLNTELEPLKNIEAIAKMVVKVGTVQLHREMLETLKNGWTSSVAAIQELKEHLTMYADIEACDTVLADTAIKEKCVTTIRSLQADHNRHTTDIELLNNFLVTVKDLDVAAADLDIYEGKASNVSELLTLEGNYTIADQCITRLSNDLCTFVGLGEAAAQIRELDKKAEKLEDLQQLTREYNVKNVLAEQVKKELYTATTDLEKAETELTKAWEEAGGICPLCDQPVGSHKH